MKTELVPTIQIVASSTAKRSFEPPFATAWIRVIPGSWPLSGGGSAPPQLSNRSNCEAHCGTPQGGVVSPILANLFLHYAFDAWMARTHADLPWCRYADDGLVHCRSEQEAKTLKAELQARLAECRLEMHPTKTRIVLCQEDAQASCCAKDEGGPFEVAL